jgi:trk system potassium uptake protein
MKVAIAGAGNVGCSIATELLANGHDVLLIERDGKSFKVGSVPGATWLQDDACEASTLDAAGLDDYQVVIAATGDDKTNLVVSLLAKTEYAVPRVVARVNHPKNEWMFNESWGVDVAVSTPRLISALVEEAVTVGDLVKLMSLRADRSLVEFTLTADSTITGRLVGDVPWPGDVALVAILRAGGVVVPSALDPLLAGDELLFVATSPAEAALQALLHSGQAAAEPATD